ncbi:MAG TPA: hypothetical protein VFJ26_19930 [Dyella sp.]|uniref:hypothetical protein n=1 Tax=Dyella sp. TaxID=1869338 RepID=UPI002DACEC6E|nr:hypothetical protein [Dyella sp.]
MVGILWQANEGGDFDELPFRQTFDNRVHGWRDYAAPHRHGSWRTHLHRGKFDFDQLLPSLPESE